MAFKCLTGRVPEYLLSQLITRIEVSRRTTRNSQKLNFPLFKAANVQRTFYYRIVITWNSLHSSLKTINSMPIFKYSPKHELLEDLDQYQYLGNCPPTPPLTQQQSIDNMLGLMLGQGRGRWVVAQILILIRRFYRFLVILL